MKSMCAILIPFKHRNRVNFSAYKESIVDFLSQIQSDYGDAHPEGDSPDALVSFLPVPRVDPLRCFSGLCGLNQGPYRAGHSRFVRVIGLLKRSAHR